MAAVYVARGKGIERVFPPTLGRKRARRAGPSGKTQAWKREALADRWKAIPTALAEVSKGIDPLHNFLADFVGQLTFRGADHLALELTSLRKAINSLERALAVARMEIVGPVDSDRKEVIRAGVIQNFELAYQLCWKFMKRWLETNLSSDAVDGLSLKELFRLSAERKLIDRVEPWFSYHLHRNKTSHTYEHATANEVFASAFDFLADAKSFLKNLESKND